MNKLITIIFILVLISSFASADIPDYRDLPPEQMCNLPEIVKTNELHRMSVEECVRQAKEHMMITQSPSHKEMEECIRNAAGDMENMKLCGERFENSDEVKKYREEQSKRFEEKFSEEEKNKMIEMCLKMNSDKEMCKEPWKMKGQMMKTNERDVDKTINPEDYKKMMEERKQMEQKMQGKMGEERKLMEEKRKSGEEERQKFEKESTENEQLFALLNVALKLESLKVELIKITNKISALENFYSSQGDSSSAERFRKVHSQFNGLISKIDGIRSNIKAKDAELSKEDIDGIKNQIRSIKEDLKGIIKTLVS